MCLIPILGSCNRSLYRDRFSDDPLFGGEIGGEGTDRALPGIRQPRDA